MHSRPHGDGSLKHLFLVGPPSVGKGLSGNKILDGRKDVHTIITGKMIVGRMKVDEEFRNKWERVVIEGDPVDDEVLSPMVDARYINGATQRFNKFLWDGWGRNPNQARSFLRKFGSHKESIIVVNINAKKETCRHRYDERNKREHRIDRGAFDTRWNHHTENIDAVLSVFNSSLVTIINVSGDSPLDIIANQVYGAWNLLTGENIPNESGDVTRAFATEMTDALVPA